MDNWILDSAGERVQQQAVFKKRKKKESWQKKKKKKKSKKIFPDETISFWETQNFSAFFKCTSINFTRAKHAHRRTHNRLLLFCAALWLSSSSRMDVGKNRGREEGAGLIWWGFYLLGRLRVIFRRLTAVSSRAHIKRGKGGNCTLSNLSEYDDGTWKKSSENNIKEISFKKKKTRKKSAGCKRRQKGSGGNGGGIIRQFSQKARLPDLHLFMLSWAILLQTGIVYRESGWGREMMWTEFNWTQRQLHSGKLSSRDSSKMFSLPILQHRMSICGVLLSINTLYSKRHAHLFRRS